MIAPRLSHHQRRCIPQLFISKLKIYDAVRVLTADVVSNNLIFNDERRENA